MDPGSAYIVMIVDFGIAKLVGDASMKSQTTAVMGTPTYMSPEQCRGAGQVDHRSDIYAMGCVLFTLLTGRPPFEAEGIGDIIAMHLREPPPSPSSRAPSISPQIDQLVARCLAKDPAQRYQSSGELAAAMGVLLGTTSSVGGYVTPVTGNYASSPSTLSAATGDAEARALDAEADPGRRERHSHPALIGASCSTVGSSPAAHLG